MQKQVIGLREVLDPVWLDVESKAAVEITSEDPIRPIESAIRLGVKAGWRAADPGPQVIRLLFNQPQHISHLRLKFTERERERTQEFVLRWAQDGRSFEEIVRQQWNFSPEGSTEELEDYRVNLDGAAILELKVNPDVSGRIAFASLDQLRIA
jgi:hypothetical protein